MVGKKENIHIEADYQNIIVIDPNKVVDGEGNVKERLLHHEELVFFANLECVLFPRTRLAVSSDGNFENQTVSLASINFVKPNNTSFLNNEYLDEITGLNSIFGKGDNQIKINEKNINKNAQSKEYYYTSINRIDNNLLHISSIEIKSNSSLMPTVRIEMVDVRGRALFELGENSPYAAFFNLPYPVFYLTFKGYLGKAIKYQLALQTFNARFETDSGNFLITCEFYAYKFNVLTDIPIRYALIAPYMYKTSYQTSKPKSSNSQAAQNQLGNTDKDVEEIITTRGYEKVKELYSEYKSYGLIPEDFPEITIIELINRLEVLLKSLTKDSLVDIDWSPITNGDNYARDLSNFERDIYFSPGESWKDTYLDIKNYYIDADTKEIIYTYKKEVTEGGGKITAKEKLKSIIGEYKKKLTENSSFGEQGKYPITFTVDEEIIKRELKYENIDFYETYLRRTGKQPVIDITNPNSGPTADFLAFKSKEFDKQLDAVKLNENQDLVYEFFVFQGDKRFLDQVQIMRTNLADKLNLIEDDIKKKLEERIKSKTPMGFKPTIRNVLAVIMANTEAFLRLMCDVHESAWDLSTNEIRTTAILGSEKSSISSDGKKSTQNTNGNLSPIYPWPQYFYDTKKQNGERWQFDYPGNPRRIAETKGNRADIWPEVEFVEEFFKGMALTKFENPTKLYSEMNNTSQHVDRVSLNAIDFPVTNVIFQNKQEVKFIYEIWERLFLYANYQRYNRTDAQRQIIDILADCEFKNIVKALGDDSPSLTRILKNYNLTARNITDVMKMASNDGTGDSWQKFIRDQFVTKYINEEVNTSFRIYFESELKPNLLVVSPIPEKFPSFIDYVKNSITNSTDILDTFPFVIEGWAKTNMAEGNGATLNSIYDTSKTYVIYDNKRMLSNFSETTTKTQVRPITNFNFITPQLNDYSSVEFFKYKYEEKYNDIKSLQVTEGRLTYDNYEGDISSNQINSMLNTPYFINAIIQGVERWQNGEPNPFVGASFLFLNSLPIATLREKYKTYENGATYDLDYIFSSFKKFGAIHRLPYAFILKYGSIWHRYKTWVETGADILDDIWLDFNADSNYDPINSDPTKTYTVTLPGDIDPTKIVLRDTSTIGTYNSTNINVGFYPRLINIFSLFLRGTTIFSGYTDSIIQEQIDNDISGINLFSSPSARINKTDSTNPLNIFSVNTWNCTIKDSLNNSVPIEYVLPSFGASTNQVLRECFDANGNLIQDIANNPAVYNGSVRTVWGLPNFGYFDNSKIKRPEPTQYFKKIFSGDSQQESFSLGNTMENSSIEELLSVFNKDILDKFESEFLSFSKSGYEYKTVVSDGDVLKKVKISGLETDTDVMFKNFQVLLRNIFSVESLSINKTNSSLEISSISKKQFQNLANIVKKFLDFDVVLKIGNPGDFNRRLMDSFVNNKTVIDGVDFGPYVPNSLPNPNNNGTPLLSYEIANPEAWTALRTYVGFSNIEGIKYTNTGSTITDFFMDMNIEFSEGSVKTLAPIIKIYATQKKKFSSLNKEQFTGQITNFLNLNQEFTNTLSDIFFRQLNAKLPTISEKRELNIDSILDGDQTKVTMWEKFKSLNDKWIGGYDYKKTTLLEDILIIDRASRNIADEAYVDPFVITQILDKSLNEEMSVYVYVESILRDHHFIPMMHPGYVNFYNIQNVSSQSQPRVEEHLNFGNTLFGTFLNVDTRDSSPKLVCTFSAAGSKYPNLGSNENFGYGDDSLSLVNPAACPLIDNMVGKSDYGLSNKVVGFNVDIGIRNQNVFYYFDVSQDLGQTTAEAILATQSMIKQYSGRGVATQNVSLWNVYQNRSYQCKVNCIGNAMIQPTMYFNLKHVPMFNGPYLIQDVTHSIKPGRFETSFTGTRQQMFSLPDLEDYIQVLTKKLYLDLKQKLKEQIKTNAQDVANSQNITETTTINATISSAVVSNTGKIGISSNCSDKLDSFFASYIPLDNTTQTYLSEKELVDGINSTIGSSSDVTKCLVFITIYLESSSNGQITKFNNNYAGVRLNYKWSGQLPSFFGNNYYCNLGSDGFYYPYATFDSVDKLYQFLRAKWEPLAPSYELTAESLLEAWIKTWNRATMSDSEFLLFKIGNAIQYQNLLYRTTEAFNKAKTLNLIQ